MRTLPKWLARDFRELIDLNLNGKCANGTAWLQQMRAELDRLKAPKRGQVERKKVAKSKKLSRKKREEIEVALVQARSGGRCEIRDAALGRR